MLQLEHVQCQYDLTGCQNLLPNELAQRLLRSSLDSPQASTRLIRPQAGAVC